MKSRVKHKNDEAARAISAKKRIVRKRAKYAAKKAGYAAYVRDHDKAFRTLAVIDSNTLNSMKSVVAKVLAKRAG